LQRKISIAALEPNSKPYCLSMEPMGFSLVSLTLKFSLNVRINTTNNPTMAGLLVFPFYPNTEPILSIQDDDPRKIRIRIPLKVLLYKRGREGKIGDGEKIGQRKKIKQKKEEKTKVKNIEETKKELIGEAEIRRTKKKGSSIFSHLFMSSFLSR